MSYKNSHCGLSECKNLSVTQSLCWLMQHILSSHVIQKSQHLFPNLVTNIKCACTLSQWCFRAEISLPFWAAEIVIWTQQYNILLQNKLRCEFRLLCKVCAHTHSKISTKVVCILVYKGQRNFCLRCCIYCRLCNFLVTAVTVQPLCYMSWK